MDIQKSGLWIGATVGVLTIIGSIGGAIFYVARQDAKIDQLERQLQLVVVAPTLPNGTPGGVKETNPIATACGNLAAKAAEQATQSSFQAENDILDIMRKMGCLVPEEVTKK